MPMKMPSSLIAEGERGHRRGVVLGLTMAELLLLLLFCLLLVSASIAQRKDERIAELQAPANLDITVSQLADMRAELARLQALFPKAALPLPPANWTELVAAKAVIDGLTEKGIDAAPTSDPTLRKLLLEISEAKAADPRLLDRLEKTLSASNDRSADAESSMQWPPMITLSDDGYTFERGSAALTDAFRARLQTKVTDDVLSLLTRYKVDVVEIVGHTDEQKINPAKPSNLDAVAISAMNGASAISDLTPADNAGLGLSRAIAVANALIQTGRLGSVKIIPLSAAQLVMPGDIIADGSHVGDVRERRRIEIRVRRSSDGGTN
ncbi:hypothetical protein FJ952_07335 [Mesorhizobium sp. B2-4-10]|nr:hypothetical protein FJ952_07335 [Mesorhizobium sp. B2-4-10]